MSFALFQTVGPLELLIVLGVVLLIFGPKRLPGLGRQLGAGMREFKDSISGKADGGDEARPPGPSTKRRPPPGTRQSPRSASGAGARGDDPAADPARGSPEPRRASRRA